MVAISLRERPTNSESVNQVKAEFDDAIMRIVELVMPRNMHMKAGNDAAETFRKRRYSRWRRQRCTPLGTTSKRI